MACRYIFFNSFFKKNLQIFAVFYTHVAHARLKKGRGQGCGGGGGVSEDERSLVRQMVVRRYLGFLWSLDWPKYLKIYYCSRECVSRQHFI